MVSLISKTSSPFTKGLSLHKASNPFLSSRGQTRNHTHYHDAFLAKRPDLEVAVLQPKKKKKGDPSRNNQTSTIIWLHGLGDSYEGFLHLMMHLIPDTTRCLIPNAPKRPVTINGGQVDRAWYDVTSLDRLDNTEDEAGINQSWKSLKAILDEEVEHLGGNSDKIVVGGFSQGGAMATLLGLQYDKPLGGIVCASGYTVLHNSFQKSGKPYFTEANKKTPLVVFHGESDQMVPYSFSKSCFDLLEKSGKENITRFIEKQQAHEITEQGIQTLRAQFFSLLQQVDNHQQEQEHH